MVDRGGRRGGGWEATADVVQYSTYECTPYSGYLRNTLDMEYGILDIEGKQERMEEGMN